MKGLHRPVTEALGSALREQCLSDPKSLIEGAFGGGARADATAASLQKLQLQLAAWAISRVGMPRKLTAKFGSWAAPLGTSLVCMAGGHDGPGEAALELHNRLLRRLLRCIKQPDTAHRVMALRCLRVQLPYLMAVKGGSRDGLAPIDQLFTGRVSGMHLELPREKDVPLLLRRYVSNQSCGAALPGGGRSHWVAAVMTRAAFAHDHPAFGSQVRRVARGAHLPRVGNRQRGLQGDDRADCAARA